MKITGELPASSRIRRAHRSFEHRCRIRCSQQGFCWGFKWVSSGIIRVILKFQVHLLESQFWPKENAGYPKVRQAAGGPSDSVGGLWEFLLSAHHSILEAWTATLGREESHRSVGCQLTNGYVQYRIMPYAPTWSIYSAVYGTDSLSGRCDLWLAPWVVNIHRQCQWKTRG